MDKPASLRKLITDSVPELKRDPSNLKIWVRSGKVASRYSAVNHGFHYAFTLHIEVRNFSGHPDLIFLPVVLWLRIYQPDLLLNHAAAEQAISFEADYLDTNEVDLDITLSLTESVDVLSVAGGYRMTHRPEPAIAGTDLIMDPPVALKRVYDQNDRLIAGYPHIYFLTGADGAGLQGTDGQTLTEVNIYE